MFKNYITVTLRNIRKYKSYSFINIVGLAIGIACSILIMLYVQYEYSYDKHHQKADRIYRIAIKKGRQNDEKHYVSVSNPLALVLNKDYPEIEQAARLQGFNNIAQYYHTTIKYNEKIFNENNILGADAGIFKIFTIPFINGNPDTALIEPNTAVMTLAAAKKYFGNDDPIGKVIVVGEKDHFKITGVVENIPETSHFHFDFLLSMTTFEWSKPDRWSSQGTATYVLVKEGFSKERFEKNLKDVAGKYNFQNSQTMDAWFKEGNLFEYYLQPLPDIHLHSDIGDEFEVNGNAANVSILLLIAIFILLIACINFMNLTTAKSVKRAREATIRKIVGSSQGQLIRQFLGESVLLSFVALALAILIVEVALPSFRNLLGKQQLNIHYLTNFFVLPSLTGLALFVGVVSGLYPAIYLSTFKSLVLHKGGSRKNSLIFKNGLVIFQFSISIILIISTFVVYRQLTSMQNKNLGFAKENVIVVKNAQSLGTSAAAFKETLLNYPGVINAAGSSSVPGMAYPTWIFKNKENKVAELNLYSCDHDFLKTFNLEMKAGRFFSKEFPTDSRAMILNEAAANEYGWTGTDAIAKQLVSSIGDFVENNPSNYNIIGIIKEFHYQSLHQKIQPLCIVLESSAHGERHKDLLSVKIQNTGIGNTLPFIETTWKRFVPGSSLEFSFLSDDLSRLYEREKKSAKIAGLFSLLAVFISCLGLLGMASFMLEQRIKEIAVRKIMGASARQIMMMLSGDFLKWVLIANAIAWPVAYLVMDKWLKDFAYRIHLDIRMFILSGLAVLSIAFFTISFQTIKAAVANPADSLKYE